MKTFFMELNPNDPNFNQLGRINEKLVDATSEEDLAVQAAQDLALAKQDAAKFAQSVRTKLGLTQIEFSQHINVSLETVRNWEQGKRSPSGAAKALLKILYKEPTAALAALS